MVIEGSRIYEWAVQKLENKGKRKQKEREEKTDHRGISKIE